MCTVAMLNRNACSILEKKAFDIESPKDIGPAAEVPIISLLPRHDRGQAKRPGDPLSSKRLVINKAHGSDWTVVFRGRPHTSGMQNMNNLTLLGTLRRQCQP